VILMERCMEMSILRRQGKSLRAIAVETGTSVNTVRKYLAAGELPRYRPRPPRAGKLDPFKDYVVKRVEAARPYWIPATVLAREIRDQGFTGCDRLVSRFVRALRPAVKEDPVVRFETAPGQQEKWVKCMEEEIIPFQVKMGMVILGSFVGEEDASVYVWIRRFESEAERTRLYDAVYQSDYWKNEISPRVPTMIDREQIKVTRIVATPRSVIQ